MEGTHLGPLFGIAPTGKSMKVNHIQIDRIVNDKIVEHWRLTDELAMYRQVGVIKDRFRNNSDISADLSTRELL
jgi:hypothetical protein